uniref:Uncharacterized protein n=1 Tax=Acrobeloides nanus TaxID=290746 RepID=A0A914BVZ1_9BILA
MPTSDEDYIPIKSKLFCHDKLSVNNFNGWVTLSSIIYLYQNIMVMCLWNKFNFDNTFVSWIELMVVYILMCIPHLLVMYGRKEKKLWTFKMYFGIFVAE